MPTRAMRRLLTAVAQLICVCVGAAQAQPYPTRPITIVVALPAGGAVDALARIIAEPMRSRLGQPIIIENLGGAGGTLAVGRVVHSAPDGYTLGLGSVGQFVISGAVYTLPFDMLADLTPVAPLPSVPYWMTARKTLPANNLKELVDWLKHNNASASTVGTASLARFCGMAFQKASGTNFQFVPYRGGAPALQDLVAGNIDLNCDFASNSLAQYRNGNIKVYAVMANTRWAPAPEVPTTDEAGFPGIYISTWLGLWAPKNTPADIVAKVNAAALAAMTDQEARKRIADLGMQVPPPERLTPSAFAAFHKAEVEKWYPIVKAAGIKAE
jgi:tripartite-type tricarboxylate transporter receptor subunit TctC